MSMHAEHIDYKYIETTLKLIIPDDVYNRLKKLNMDEIFETEFISDNYATRFKFKKYVYNNNVAFAFEINKKPINKTSSDSFIDSFINLFKKLF